MAPRLPARLGALATATVLLLAACATPNPEAEEAARNTFACSLDGQRLVVRFDAGEARLLLPDGDRVTLYQVPAASGVRYTNGVLELRGKGTDLVFVREGVAAALERCQPLAQPG